MQVTTRYLCLSGTLLGWAAESSCVFCTNVAAVADKHLAEIKGGFGICSPWYGTGHTTRWSAWTQTNARQMSRARSWDHLLWKKRRDILLPCFLSTDGVVQGALCYARECAGSAIPCSPPTPSTQCSSCFQVQDGKRGVNICQTFSNTGFMSSLLCTLDFHRKRRIFAAGVVYLQGPSHAFLIPELGSYVRSPSNSLFMQSYSKGKKKTGKGSGNPINSGAGRVILD